MNRGRSARAFATNINMLKLEIVTPERKVFEGNVDSVTVPTLTGEAGLLASHVPLISALKPGVLSYTEKGHTEKIAVSDGFIEINSDNVSILTNSADAAEELDLVKVKADRDDAEKALNAVAGKAIEETEEERARLELAEARLQIAASKY